MRVEVKRSHIKHGIARSAWGCPIYLALKAAGVKNPCVGPNSFNFDVRDKRACKALPKKVQNWIGRFDDGYAGKPFVFTLELRG